MQCPQGKTNLLQFANVDLGHSGVMLQSNALQHYDWIFTVATQCVLGSYPLVELVLLV